MAQDLWSVKAALDWTASYLAQKSDENPRLSAEWLVGCACELSRIELYVNFDRPLSTDERARLHDYVLRRAQGEPLQYITGEVGFRHITVKVKPGVLIPRPETEVLVSQALSLVAEPTHDWEEAVAASEAALAAQLQAELEEAEKVQREAAGTDQLQGGARVEEADGVDGSNAADKIAEDVEAGEGSETGETNAIGELGVGNANGESAKRGSEVNGVDGAMSAEQGQVAPAKPQPAGLRVVDLCTGSGCIACSLAYEHPQMQVIATDIAPEAVSLAQENVARLGLGGRVAVLCCDLAEKIPERLEGTFDLVISNPPYIPTDVLPTLSSEVRDFEPVLALDGGKDGNDFVRRILPWAQRALKAGGAFALELHETCLESARDYACELGFGEVTITCDLTGAPRVLSGRKIA